MVLDIFQHTLKIDKSIWTSLQRRKSNESGFTLTNAVEYLILDFVINDFLDGNNTIITKKMYDDKLKQFRQLEKDKEAKKA